MIPPRPVTVALSVLLAACSAPTTPPAGRAGASDGAAEETPTVEALLGRSCELPGEAESRPVGDARSGGSIGLATRGKDRVAYVADAEGGRVHVVDARSGAVRSAVRLGGKPRQLAVVGDGRVVVTLEDEASVVVLAPSTDRGLGALCARRLPDGPWGVAVSADDADVIVTSAWAGAVTVLDAATFTPRATVAVPRAPRGVVVGERRFAYVTHLVGGTLSRVDLDALHVGPTSVELAARASSPLVPDVQVDGWRTASQGYALTSVIVAPSGGAEAPTPSGRFAPELGPGKGTRPKAPAPYAEGPPERILAPLVSVDPGSPRTGANYYSAPLGMPRQTAAVSAVDPSTARPLSDRVLAMSPLDPVGECLLPRAIKARGGLAFVACQGIDAVLTLDARALDPSRAELRRVHVPEGPTGLALDESGGLLVHSEHARAVTALDARGGVVWSTLLHGGSAGEAWIRGRKLFHRTDEPNISRDGVGCASCHPDGLEDGVTWTTPEGPRQTPMLAGRLHGTAPYGWSRDQTTLARYVTDTIGRLGGRGLADQDMTALVAYLEALPAPRPRRDEAAGERGRELFYAEDVGCATCHVAGRGVDGRSHALAGAHPMDTPSLRFVGATAPYFHDGRYATLEELLSDPRSHMGASHVLATEDRAALAAFLRSL